MSKPIAEYWMRFRLGRKSYVDVRILGPVERQLFDRAIMMLEAQRDTLFGDDSVPEGIAFSAPTTAHDGEGE